jgi:hypothetical protein
MMVCTPLRLVSLLRKGALTLNTTHENMELNITFCSLFSEHVIPPLVSDRLERVYIAPRGHVLVADIQKNGCRMDAGSGGRERRSR